MNLRTQPRVAAFSLLFLIGIAKVDAQTTWYVDGDAPPAGDGATWCTAYLALQDALGAAVAGDSVLVANGAYPPDQGTGQSAGDRAATFQLKTGVDVRGGYAGCGAPDPDERDPVTNVTTLSGDIGIVSDTSDNSFNVVTATSVDQTAVLDGFTIRDGNSSGGGALGAGMRITGSGPTIRGCIFRDNLGNGLFSSGATTASVIDSMFINNSPGARIQASDVPFTNCVFSRNTRLIGGGLYVEGNAASDVSNCTFSGNTTSQGGAAIYVESTSTASIHNCIVWGNSGAGGSQIHEAFGPNTVTVTYTDIAGGASGVSGSITLGAGIINADPLFADAVNDDLRIGAGSPCIDAGDNAQVLGGGATDLDGHLRFVDDVCIVDTGNGSPPVVDMGAYESLAVTTVDNGSTVVLDPLGGVGSDPTDVPTIEFTNSSGSDGATVTVSQDGEGALPNAGEFQALGTVVGVETSLLDGEFFTTLTIPFVGDDLDGDDPLTVDLLWLDTSSGDWLVAVAGNTQNSPGHPGPIGDRITVEDTVLPTLSTDLGDYGVYWNPVTIAGFAWTNVDHFSTFVPGLSRACSHGSLDMDEQCDDGDLDPGDGCSSDCTVETGFICSGEPSVCEPDFDGDLVGDGQDNCRTVANGPAQEGLPGVGNQTDSDGDGLGDACDLCFGNCSDENSCTTDVCVVEIGCVHNGTGVTSSCDDGVSCTSGDTCQGDPGGTCQGTECIFDLDGNTVMGTGDFALFASCFDACYPAGDPCSASNFDGDPSRCVGSSDFAAWLGCFGLACGECAGCAGPGLRGSDGGIASATLSRAFYMSGSIQIVARRTPSSSDVALLPPRSTRLLTVGEEFYIELWASRTDSGIANTSGLASAFVDLMYDPVSLAVEGITPSGRLGIFSGGQIVDGSGLVSSLGGCASLGETTLGVDGAWVRVSTLAMRATATGTTRVSVGPSDELHGVAVVGEFTNMAPGMIEFGHVDLTVRRAQKPKNRLRGRR